MKKRGFTLIELIVVLAIIGILCAILVPCTFGYVRKAKITSANSSAAEVIKTANIMLSESTEQIILDDGSYALNCTAEQASGGTFGSLSEDVEEYILTYDDTMTRYPFALQIYGGVAVVAATKNGNYFGTYPAFLSHKNYDDELGENPTLGSVLETTFEYYANKKGIEIEEDAEQVTP